MNETEWPRQQDAKAVRVDTEEHLRQQIAKSVEQEHGDREHHHEPYPVIAQCLMELRHQPPEDEEVRYRIADQDGPQEVLRVFEIIVQHLG
jgi:hypothetical protein